MDGWTDGRTDGWKGRTYFCRWHKSRGGTYVVLAVGGTNVILAIGWTNVVVGQMSVGQTSVGQMSVAKTSVGEKSRHRLKLSRISLVLRLSLPI
jgi:hypothetical protein